MRRIAIVIFLAVADGFLAAILSWQVWGLLVVASGIWCVYLFRSEFCLGYHTAISWFRSLALAKKIIVVISGCCLGVALGILAHSFLLPVVTTQCIRSEFDHINRVIRETNREIFQHELRHLYHKLEQCGLRVPVIDPVQLGFPKYDNTWKGFHMVSLKVLRMQVEDGSFDLEQWDKDFERENAKRKNVAQRYKAKKR